MKVSPGENTPQGEAARLHPVLEFYHLERLFRQMMTTGKAIISNQPAEDIR